MLEYSLDATTSSIPSLLTVSLLGVVALLFVELLLLVDRLLLVVVSSEFVTLLFCITFVVFVFS